MDRIALMEAFTRVAIAGSFSAAAQEMRLSKAAISKYVSTLEDRLGARLLNRSTRRLSLTEIGQAYFQHCNRILAEIEEADLAVSRHHAEPCGRLRVSAPVCFGVLHVTPAVAAFLKLYPRLRIELNLHDRLIDPIEEGYDLALRLGPMPDSSLISRRIASATAFLCASPDYLAQHGLPASAYDLRHHNCLRLADMFDRDEWLIEGPDGDELFTIGGNLRVNNADALRSSVIAGLGIAPLPDYVAGRDIAEGRLVRLLPEYKTPSLDVHAVYPHNRHLSTKVRVFIDFLAARFRDHPDWST